MDSNDLIAIQPPGAVRDLIERLMHERDVARGENARLREWENARLREWENVLNATYLLCDTVARPLGYTDDVVLVSRAALNRLRAALEKTT